MISKLEENLGDTDIKNFTVSPLYQIKCIDAPERLRALGVCRTQCCRCHDACNRRATHLLNYCQHPICNLICLEADARREISSLHLLSAKMGDEWE